MKTYIGKIVKDQHRVEVREGLMEGTFRYRELDPRLDLENHSPAHPYFAWGYMGSGPSQLSLAILADALESDMRAHNFYMSFKLAFIAALDGDREWEISDSGVKAIIRIMESRQAA